MPINMMIDNSLVAAVVSNPRLPDNPIVACNKAFMDLTGYAEHEIIGRNCRFLRGEGTEPELTKELRVGIAAKVPVMVELLNYKKDGTPFRNAVMIAPIFDPEGELEYFLGSQVEVPGAAQKTADSRAAEAREKVATLSRRQREILQCIAAGRLNKQIAFELGLSERTIKLHRAAVLRALGVRTSADAIRMAIEAGL
ncbi:LuxR C-terminal-related transcriptional regulator [Novosphingobium sp. Chol11]|uniref:LuxR C-terminal-related transcriptional regulator n=1 Tax=Novosphingobium sp. Chol11 TaxID=1385763 RepID=UPI0025F4EF4D|nr:LuxR C-terminal-related transcriptional regulator [Novosphingobium sp. Chol11]